MIACGTAAVATAAASRVVRIRATGVVQCGSVVRPGIASVDGIGRWRGLAVDVCRAFARARNQVDDLSFLTGREMSVNNLLGAIVPGPTVFVATDGLMVPNDSQVGHAADLKGKDICFKIAGTAEQGLAANLGAPGTTWFAMEDAYAVRRCAATPTDDGAWAAIVAWTVYTLIDAERPETEWFAGGAHAMPLATELGLAADWQSRVLWAPFVE